MSRRQWTRRRRGILAAGRHSGAEAGPAALQRRLWLVGGRRGRGAGSAQPPHPLADGRIGLALDDNRHVLVGAAAGAGRAFLLLSQRRRADRHQDLHRLRHARGSLDRQGQPREGPEHRVPRLAHRSGQEFLARTRKGSLRRLQSGESRPPRHAGRPGRRHDRRLHVGDDDGGRRRVRGLRHARAARAGGGDQGVADRAAYAADPGSRPPRREPAGAGGRLLG